MSEAMATNAGYSEQTVIDMLLLRLLSLHALLLSLMPLLPGALVLLVL